MDITGQHATLTLALSQRKGMEDTPISEKNLGTLLGPATKKRYG
jgi:hypothetical protein